MLFIYLSKRSYFLLYSVWLWIVLTGFKILYHVYILRITIHYLFLFISEITLLIFVKNFYIHDHENIGLEFYFLIKFLSDFNIQVIQVLQYKLVLSWKICKRFIFFFSEEFKIVDQWSLLELNLYLCVSLCMSVCIFNGYKVSQVFSFIFGPFW